MKCNLYLVAFHYDDNFDLLVWARTREEAEDLWKAEWSEILEPDFEPDNVFLIPTECSGPGVVPWASLLT